MGTILNGKYLSLPEQVQKNKNDIEIINQYLQNVYKTSSILGQDTTSINIEYTDIDINKLNFALLIDRKGHIFKIVDVIGEVVYLNFLTDIVAATEYNFTGEWVSDNNEYYENDLVLYNGNLYLCEANVINSSTPPNEDIQHWSLFVGYGNDISEFVKSEYEKSQTNEGPIVHYKALQELTDIVNKKANKLDSAFQEKIYYTESISYIELNLNDLLPSTNNRAQIKIEGIRNGGGTVYALIGVSNRTNSEYVNTVVTSLGSNEVVASFDINTQILRLGGLNNYGVYLVTIIS